MIGNTLKISLLSGVAVTALLLGDPRSARAQMYSTSPGVYLSLEGRYLMSHGNKTTLYPESWAFIPTATDNAKARADKGWGGKAMLGYRFSNNWDVGFGLSAGWLKGKGHAGTAFTTAINDGFATSFVAGESRIKTKLSYQVADFEAGYNWTMGQNSNLRLFGGLRFAHFTQKTKGRHDFIGSTATPETDYVQITSVHSAIRRKTSFTGVGPRLGINGQVGLGNSGFNVFGGLSGALLFGKYKDKHSYATSGFTRFGSGSRDQSVKDKSKTKIVPNAEGEIGLGYNFNTGGGSTVGLQLGYRADGWWGVTSKAPVFPGYSPAKASTSADVFTHGPFVRLVATFGSAPAAPVAPPLPAAQPASTKKNFIVFFDFDKSNITAEAQKTINQAATAAKAGQASQVTLTGHTDRSGSEQYNMALSLRRAEAVKASLIKLGVPASLIVVIGKGESQPLVPTADGVREPQNRRVEIVI